MRVHDISQPLTGATAVWPGEEPVRVEWTARLDRGDPANVAVFSMGTHAGTHLDGPAHIRDGAPRLAELPIEAFVGPARVVDARGRDPLDADLAAAAGLDGAERVLFRTRERVDSTSFPESFVAISPALARALVDAGIRLVGTDAPSIDPLGAETLEAHGILLGAGVAVLENAVLDDVAPGDYLLVALPLALAETDSAPVRAVLIET